MDITGRINLATPEPATDSPCIIIDNQTNLNSHTSSIAVSHPIGNLGASPRSNCIENIVSVAVDNDKGKKKACKDSITPEEQTVNEEMIPEYLSCTACNEKINPRKSRKVCMHPRLLVLLCKSCLKFINSNVFTKDEMGSEEYCTWCGDGGSLVCCDFCEKAYCKHCIKRNLGKPFLKSLLEADDDVKWKCFACDKEQIASFINECKIYLQYASSLAAVHISEAAPNAPHPIGPSKVERKKRLSEVARQVQSISSEPVRLKSSFPKYEISDDDNEAGSNGVTPPPPGNIQSEGVKATKDDKNSVFRFASSIPVASGFSHISNNKVGENAFPLRKQSLNTSKRIGSVQHRTKNCKNSNEKAEGTVHQTHNSNLSTPSIYIEKNSDTIDKTPISSSIHTVSNSGKRARKEVNYNEKVLQKNLYDSVSKKDEETEPSKDKKRNRESEISDDGEKRKKPKKRRTVIMISSEEGSDEEIIVMSKSGKKRIISKSVLLLAQAALDKSEHSKKAKSKKDKSFLRLSFSHKKNKSGSSIEDSSYDSESATEIDKEKPKQRIKFKKSHKRKVEIRQKDKIVDGVVVDEQKPGPSGVRPKNKLQRQKQEGIRPSSSSDSSEGDDSLLKNAPRSGILSSRFRVNRDDCLSNDKKLISIDLGNGSSKAKGILLPEKEGGKDSEKVNENMPLNHTPHDGDKLGESEYVEDNIDIANELSEKSNAVSQETSENTKEKCESVIVENLEISKLKNNTEIEGETIIGSNEKNGKPESKTDMKSNEIREKLRSGTTVEIGEINEESDNESVTNEERNKVREKYPSGNRSNSIMAEKKENCEKENNLENKEIRKKSVIESQSNMDIEVKEKSQSELITNAVMPEINGELESEIRAITESSKVKEKSDKACSTEVMVKAAVDIQVRQMDGKIGSTEIGNHDIEFSDFTLVKENKKVSEGGSNEKDCIYIDSKKSDNENERHTDSSISENVNKEMFNTTPNEELQDSDKNNAWEISDGRTSEPVIKEVSNDIKMDVKVQLDAIDIDLCSGNESGNHSDYSDTETLANTLIKIKSKKLKEKGKCDDSEGKEGEMVDSDCDSKSARSTRKSSRIRLKIMSDKEHDSSTSDSQVKKKNKSSNKEIEVVDSKSENSSDGMPIKRSGSKKAKGKVRNKSMNIKSKRKDLSSSDELVESGSESDSDDEDDTSKKINLKVKKKGSKCDSDEIGSSSSNYVESGNDLDSDSTSSEGSIIITRRSRRIQKSNLKKKKKKDKTKAKKNVDAVELSDDDSEAEVETPSKSRKKIRRILKDDELDKETIRARELEEQRQKRLRERTKADREEVNLTVDVEDGDFILEKNDKKEALVAVAAYINKHLKPHQRKGIQFMYDCLIETVSTFKKGDDGGGCLLAHCMGLGKTLQIVCFLHTIMNNENLKLSRILVVAPLNTVLNWEQEFAKWLPDDERIDLYVLSYSNGNKERMHMLKDWFENGGVVITGYEMYRNLISCKFMRSKKMKIDVKKFLADPGPEIVVCDEGHVLRNSDSAISKAMNAIKTKRRIVLTGTPLQNNLAEYHVMVDFIKPKLLGNRKEFQNRFVNPIHNGQCSNSTQFDVRIMKQRCHVLYQLLSGCVQRQDYSVLTPFLPQKREYTIFVRLGEKQRTIYQHYLEEFVYRDANQKLKGSSLFSDFQCLARIWAHPWALHISRVRSVQAERSRQRNNMDEFLDDEESSSSDSGEENEKKPWTADTSSDEDESKRRKRRRAAVKDSDSSSDNNSSDHSDNNERGKRISTRNTRSTRSKKIDLKSDGDSKADSHESNTEKVVQRGSLRSGINFKDGSLNPEREVEEEEYEKEWFDQFLEEGDEHNIEIGGKLVLLLEILGNAEAVGDKVLVFSQSLTTLDLIEEALCSGKVEETELNWCHGVDYFRMDGSTPVSKRKRWADIFNDPENEQCRLFLISTKAGSLGINMVGANRVVVFDCSWNPSHDVQSVFRVYRFGQTKPVYVYRFIAQGTMEEKIYGRQITKMATAGRVVDEMQIERHFTDEEIRELYTFCPEKITENCETPQLPKDPLLAEVIQRLHPKHIVRYHEHDILLENLEEEELSEEERKLAWKNFEQEKEDAAKRLDFRIPPPTILNTRFPILSQQQRTHISQFNSQFNSQSQVHGNHVLLQQGGYRVTVPAEMSLEDRQRVLVELRRRELLRLMSMSAEQHLNHSNYQQTGNFMRTPVPSTHHLHNSNQPHRITIPNGMRPTNVTAPYNSNILSRGQSRILLPRGQNTNSSNPLLTSTGVQNTNIGNRTAGGQSIVNTGPNVSNVNSVVQQQPNFESSQGGYLSARKKSQPTRVDIT